VLFPPHRAIPAARTITTPIFQARILTPPSHLERFICLARKKKCPGAVPRSL